MDEYDVAPYANEAGGIFSDEQLPEPYGQHLPENDARDVVPVQQLPSEPQEPATTFVPVQHPAVAQQAVGAVPAQDLPHVMPNEAGHMLGLSLVALGAGTYLGYRYGGVFGSLAGALVGGAAINGLRAALYLRRGAPEDKREALVSGSYALVGAVGAAVLWYKTLYREAAPESPGPGRAPGSLVKFDMPGVRKAGP